MIWKLFGSEEKIRHAIEESVGYNISPRPEDIVQLPANDQASAEAYAGTLMLEKGATRNAEKHTVDNSAAPAEPYFSAPWNGKIELAQKKAVGSSAVASNDGESDDNNQRTHRNLL
ncbi:MAG: hypothetical protein PW788_06960 [Micavibrio sp.]|nr:hypothetical protein [Micavibrio sp.]